MLYRALTIPLFCSIASASAFAFAFASASASAWQQHQHDPSALGDSTGQAFKTPGDNDLDVSYIPIGFHRNHPRDTQTLTRHILVLRQSQKL